MAGMEQELLVRAVLGLSPHCPFTLCWAAPGEASAVPVPCQDKGGLREREHFRVPICSGAVQLDAFLCLELMIKPQHGLK